MTMYDDLASEIDRMASSDQELYVGERTKRKVEWDGETVKSVETERDSGASLRITSENRIGFSYANKFELDAEWLVDQAERTRDMLPEDPNHNLSSASPSVDRITDWYDPAIEESSSDKMERITEQIRRYLDSKETVSNLQVSFSETTDNTKLYRNARTLADERFSRFMLSVWAVCDDGEDVQSGFERQGSYSYSDIDVSGVIESAITRGERKLGAEPPDSRTGPAVLDKPAASGLLKLIKQMTNGESVVKGRSAWDENKLGETVGDNSLTIKDDPSLENGAGNRCFDAEGHSMDPVSIIDEGVYQSFLTNQYVSNRTGQTNNCRASRTYASRPGVGTTNFFLQPGESNLEDMKRTLSDGPVITGIQPASGLDSVSGHFSVGCSGYFVKDGEYRQPFDEATISGDIEDFLGNLEAIGDERPRGYSVASPALLVSELSLGGN